MKIGQKIVMVFLVLNGVGIAVAMMLNSGLGTDSIGLLCDGIHSYFNITYGLATFGYNLILIGIAWFFAKKYLAVGSVAYALISGFFIEFYIWIFEYLALSESIFALRFIMAFFGILLLALSLATLIQLELGMNALDAIVKWLSTKTGISYKVLRTCADVTYAFVGAILGGVFGVATIISVLLTGYFIDFFGKKINYKKREGGISYEQN